MSEKQDKERESGVSEEDLDAACEGDYEEEFEYSEDVEDFEGSTTFLKPMQGKKVWIVLSAILVVVAVAVLYVYQAGDKKTILGNQPIPIGQLNAPNSPVAGGVQNVPLGGGVQNVPLGGGVQNVPFGGGSIQAPATGGAAASTVLCPQCAMTGLSVCTSCGTVMQPLGDGSGLFACPSCGSVGIPLCPRDGAHMTLQSSASARPAVGAAGNVGGQFQCPACGMTGLPNWSPNGTPICPNCKTQMNVRSGSNTRVAVRP